MKKLLLTLAISTILMCMLVICVSAATITTVDGDELTVTTYDDAPARTNITVSTDDVVVFDDNFVCPTAYIFKDDAINYWDSDGDARVQYLLDFTYINAKRATETGNESFAYTYANIKEFDFPEGVVHVTKRAFQSVTTIKKVTVPKTVKTISSATFQNATGLEEFVFEHGENDDLTTLPGHMFYGCSSLEAISLPDCVTSIGDVATFTKCSELTAVYLSKNLTTWVSGGGGSGGGTFDYCNYMYFVNEPFTYDAIPEKPDVYYFPAGLTSNADVSKDFSNQSTMRDCTSINSTVVFGEKVTNFNNAYFFQNAQVNVVFLGDMEAASMGSGNWYKTTLYFANSADKSTDDVAINSYNASRTIFCNAEDNTTHLYEKTVTVGATCTLAAGTHELCFCGYAISSEIVEGSVPLGHSSNGASLTICYPTTTDDSGNEIINYFANAIHSYVCQNEGCGKSITEEKENSALFTEKGYSKEEDGNAFTYGISLNKTAETAYISAGNKISYGFIIGAVPAEATGNIVSADGTTALENHIILDFTKLTNEKLSIYNVRMYGLTDAQKATTVYCCAYIIDSENVYYIGENVTKTAVAISYNLIPTTETEE